MEFLEASAGTCTFAGIYILGIEWVSSKYRVLGSTLIAISFPFGEMMLGLVAMHVKNYHHLLRMLYTPGLFVIFYFWLVPESVRWLLVTGKIERAVNVLKKIASVNGKKLSNKSIEMLKLRYAPNSAFKNMNGTEKEQDTQKPSIVQSIRTIIKSKTLFLRFLNCCYQWVTHCYCFYGLSLISTHVGENGYASFILIAAVEIPGVLISLPLLHKYPRRKLMFISLALTGIATISTPFVAKEDTTMILILFMIAKCSITFSFNALYIYTAEQWPTSLRTTIMNSCSMIGRIGAMIAPLTPLLVRNICDLIDFINWS